MKIKLIRSCFCEINLKKYNYILPFANIKILSDELKINNLITLHDIVQKEMIS